MKKAIFLAGALLAVLLMSMASAALLDIFKARTAASSPAAKVPAATSSGFDSRPTATPSTASLSPILNIDEAGLTGDSEDGPGVYAHSISNAALVGISNEGAGIIARSMGEGRGVDAYSADGSAVYSVSDDGAAVHAISHNSIAIIAQTNQNGQYSGMFLGGKGIVSENGYSVRQSGRDLQGVSGSLTVDGWAYTFTNGILTSKVRV